MHCKIIQVENEPIPESRRLTEMDLPGWFTASIADYVDDDIDEDEALEIVTNHFNCSGIHFDPGNRTVTFTDTEYFRERFDQFKEILTQMLKLTTFDEFCRGLSLEMADLNDAYDDKFGDYIYHDGMLLSLDDFVRNCANSGQVYYVGGVLDYHY